MAATNHHNIPIRLDALPIPPAALVIDLRSISDDLLDTLQIEIENLASEMNMRVIPHWRYLTDFLCFKHLPQLTVQEIEALVSSAQQQLKRRTLSGRYQQGDRRQIGKYYVDEEEEPSFLDHLSNDELKRNIEESMVEINAIRNKRLEAVGDLERSGKVGRHAMDPKVQVIFIIDAERPDTLSSAAAYAALLKHEYSILEKDGQFVLDSMAICLNHDNRGTVPKKLLNRLRWPYFASMNKSNDEWQHLNSLILSERYGANAVNIPKSVQSYIAELLLYALLIAQPPQVRPAAPDREQLFLPPPKAKEVRSLPAHTYVVGLSAVEYSARWGRLMLNYDLATEAIEVLQDVPLVDQSKTVRDVETWLSDWRDLVRSLVPDKVTGDIPALQAFSHTDNVTRPANEIFVSPLLNLDTGDKTIRAIKEYSSTVAQSYTTSIEERETARKAEQKKEGKQNVTLPPTLEDALESVPLIQQEVVNVWQDREQEVPLTEAIVKVCGVLGDLQFFTGAKGSVSRARMQLRQMSKSIAAFQNKHKQSAVKLKERRDDLEKMSQQRIEDLKKYLTRFPFLTGFLKLKGLLATVTLSFLLVLGVVFSMIVMAWIHHVGLLLLPNVILALDITLLGISFYSMIVFLVSLIAIVVFYYFFHRRVLDKKRSALWVETFFVATLLAFAIFGWIITLSTLALSLDPSSLAVLFLLLRIHLPLICTIFLVVSIVILVVEVLYYFWWFNRLARVRVRIIDDVRAHQQETAQAVKHYLADIIALDLLKRAQLTDGNGGEGQYYQRIEELSHELDEIHRYTRKESQLATQRLTSRANDKVGSSITTKKVPTIRIREELLNVEMLTLKDKKLRESLTDKREEFKEFAEILLRTMGEEIPASIESEMRNRPFVVQQLGEQSYQESREQHETQLLMSTSVAIALRMAVSMPRKDVVTLLRERYRELDYRITDEYSGLNPLLELMETKVASHARSQSNERAALATSPEGISLQQAGYSLALWGQMLWEHRDKELHTMLASFGIFHHLQQKGYDPQTVRSLLATHTVVTGRSTNSGQLGELYILFFPSEEGRQYFQDMHLDPHFLDIPDTERILLLYIGQYVAEPQYIVDDTLINDEPDTNPPKSNKSGFPDGEDDNIVDTDVKEEE